MRTQLFQTGWIAVKWDYLDILAVTGILSLILMFIKVARVAKLLFNRVTAVLENANESVQTNVEHSGVADENVDLRLGSELREVNQRKCTATSFESVWFSPSGKVVHTNGFCSRIAKVADQDVNKLKVCYYCVQSQKRNA